MGRIKELIDKYGKLDVKAQEKDLLKVVVKNQNFLVNLNREQLLNGINAKGGSLGRYQSKSYAKFKRTLNPKGVVDLKLTGRFQSAMFVKNSRWPLLIDSHDVKTPKLVAKYKNIFGVTPQNEKRFFKKITSDIRTYYKNLYRIQRNNS